MNTIFRNGLLLALLCLFAGSVHAQSTSGVSIRLLSFGETPQELYYLNGKEPASITADSNGFSQPISYRGNPNFALFDRKPVFSSGGQLQTTPLATIKLPSGMRELVLVLFRGPDGKFRLQGAPIPKTGDQLCVINTVPVALGLALDDKPVKLAPLSTTLAPLNFSVDAKHRQRFAIKLFAQAPDGEWKLMRTNGSQLRTNAQPYLLVYAPPQGAAAGENQIEWSVFYRPLP